MKKTCLNCKALGLYRCELEFKITNDFRPLEECPKPTTYDEFIYLQEQKRNGLMNEELIALLK